MSLDALTPPMDPPVARAARVGAFMAVMVTDCYDESDRRTFPAGMRTLDAACQQQHGAGYLKASPEQRTALLERLDREQFQSRDQEGAPRHYFRMMKELTIHGYFTSEIGCTKALRYVEAPGRYDPCAPHPPGDKIWASHA